MHYTYDANGNRLSAEGEAGLVTGTYDDQDRLLTYGNATYTYTANGELATKTAAGQTTSYVYDTLGNLLQVTKPNGDLITYTVDGRGRRVGKSINGVRVKGWLYADQLRPIAELDGAGDVVSRFVYGTKPNVPDYIIRNGNTYRVFSDHLGSPRVIVDATTGVIVQRMDFQAFGEIIQDSNPGWQPFGFVAGLYDPDTGVVRFGVRDYDAHSGRWLAKDTLRFMAAESNRYAYVKLDPMNRIDPTGEIGLPGAVIGGLMSLAVQVADNYMNGKDVLDPGNYNGSDILIDAAVGAVAPGVLSTASRWLKAPGAIETISRQLETAVSAARRAKLEARLAKYTTDVNSAIASSAAWQLLKNTWKSMTRDFQGNGGSYCPSPQSR